MIWKYSQGDNSRVCFLIDAGMHSRKLLALSVYSTIPQRNWTHNLQGTLRSEACVINRDSAVVI